MIKGFACGVFDLCHPGHILMLKECKEHCDFLTIGLNCGNEFSKLINPQKNSPIFSLSERKLIIESIKYVDEVIAYKNEEELSCILEKNNFDIRFIGDDYFGKTITGFEYCKNIYYIDRSHGYSTSNLKKMILQNS